MQSLTDTIVAIATASGQAAIAMVRLSGPEAIRIADDVFSGARACKGTLTQLHYGFVEVNGDAIDEVLATVFHGPNSYTGEDSVEITCHGSDYIARRILEVLIDKGARMAGPGEFTMRAFANGKMDLSQAESVADLIAAHSEASRKLALATTEGRGFQPDQGAARAIDKLRESP